MASTLVRFADPDPGPVLLPSSPLRGTVVRNLAASSAPSTWRRDASGAWVEQAGIKYNALPPAAAVGVGAPPAVVAAAAARRRARGGQEARLEKPPAHGGGAHAAERAVGEEGGEESDAAYARARNRTARAAAYNGERHPMGTPRVIKDAILSEWLAANSKERGAFTSTLLHLELQLRRAELFASTTAAPGSLAPSQLLTAVAFAALGGVAHVLGERYRYTLGAAMRVLVGAVYVQGAWWAPGAPGVGSEFEEDGATRQFYAMTPYFDAASVATEECERLMHRIVDAQTALESWQHTTEAAETAARLRSTVVNRWKRAAHDATSGVAVSTALQELNRIRGEIGLYSAQSPVDLAMTRFKVLSMEQQREFLFSLIDLMPFCARGRSLPVTARGCGCGGGGGGDGGGGDGGGGGVRGGGGGVCGRGRR